MENTSKYIAEIIITLATGSAREHAYRPAFLRLIESLNPELKVINDPARSEHGAPDFVFFKGDLTVGYTETKDIGVNLDKVEKGEQMQRYFGYSNLILTDYLEFRFFRNGERYGEPIKIGMLSGGMIVPNEKEYELLERTIKDFLQSPPEKIKSGVRLAKIMGGKAQRIRDNVRAMLLIENNRYEDLLKMRDVVKEHLVSGLDNEAFADMYAQTLVYGLFVARFNDTTVDTFSRAEARELVPKANPFLRSFFDHIAGTSFPERLRYIVDELCEVFSHAAVEKILHDFYGKEKDNKDPIIHFYEDFLREYDAKKKIEMGVFYTPRPVVQFIVRAVDDILKNEFGLAKGLTDSAKISIERKELNARGREVKVQKEYHKVQVLDVATGTGTFLNEVIKHVHRDFTNQGGRWPAYVQYDLLPRLHGFELMMASYTIAHLKLGMTLHDTGAGGVDTRLGVYLTNTLESPVDYANQGTLFGIMDSIAQESKNASRIKSEYPIMCVIGNPPYSGESMNPNYIDNDVYKVEPGGKEKLKERNSKWVNDDYVKFIRFAESLIEKNGEGIVGMITAHGYIDNPTFRGMRWHLRKSFDKIYVIDLHGNSNKKETSPDGSKDENVFDIKTGVSIILGVKKKSNTKDKKLAIVYVCDIYGKRSIKFQSLDASNIGTLNWGELSDDCNTWKVEGESKSEYNEGFLLNKLFKLSSIGLQSHRDGLVVDFDRDSLSNKIQKVFDSNYSLDFLKNLLEVKDSGSWNFELARNKAKEFDQSLIKKLTYRPFDDRYIYYSDDFVDRTRKAVGKHIAIDNMVLNFPKATKLPWKHILITKSLPTAISLDINGSYCAPLYLYTDQGEKTSNLSEEIQKRINETAGETTPEDILDYVYAVLHSPSYQKRYKEFLKTDFPRVPYPKNKEKFWKLVPLGTKLRESHLMTAPECSNLITTFSESGSNMVERVKYTEGKVSINETQFFGNVPEVAWNFYIGGYQPAQKWLKDRKGRALSNADLEHYQKMIVVLVETDRIMKKIDQIKETKSPT